MRDRRSAVAVGKDVGRGDKSGKNSASNDADGKVGDKPGHKASTVCRLLLLVGLLAAAVWVALPLFASAAGAGGGAENVAGRRGSGSEEPFVGGFRVLRQLRRVPDCYTQGLYFKSETELVESCGMYQESALRLVKILASPKKLGQQTVDLSIVSEVSLPNPIFAEGCDLVETHDAAKKIIVQLSSMENVAYVWDQDFRFIGSWQVSSGILSQGWGFTSNPGIPGTAYMTDGSSNIYYYKLPEISEESWEERKLMEQIQSTKPSMKSDFTLIRKIEVKDSKTGQQVEHLNELAFWPGGCEGGSIFANLYMTNKIVQICINSGLVLKSFDFERLEKIARENAKQSWSKTLQGDECLNGVAIPPTEMNSAKDSPYPRRLLITGKRWPLLFEVELEQ